jgi:hypothetical protein
MTNACMVIGMTENGLFTVSLDEYREVLSRQGKIVTAAVSRLRTEREMLKDRVLGALAAGMSEVEASKLSGVTRETVRKWQGK